MNAFAHNLYLYSGWSALSIFFGGERKNKKRIDKWFLRVYDPTRKGKGVFERKFSEALFTFADENTYNLIEKGKGVFYGAGKSAMTAILAFLFLNWKEWDDEEGIGFFRM